MEDVTNCSHDGIVAIERGERRILHRRAGHQLRKDGCTIVPWPGTQEHVQLRDMVDRWARVEDIRAQARVPMHVEGVARGGRAVVGGMEVLRRVHRMTGSQMAHACRT